jgi:hypothetical protein
MKLKCQLVHQLQEHEAKKNEELTLILRAVNRHSTQLWSLRRHVQQHPLKLLHNNVLCHQKDPLCLVK